MSDVPPDPAQAGRQPTRRASLRRRRSRSAAGPPTRGQTTGELDQPDGPRTAVGPQAHASKAPAASVSTAPSTSIATTATGGAGGETALARSESPRREDGREDGPRRDRRRQRPDNAGDGPWRELTGSGRSQVTQAAAMRARDADQPTPEDLARAEREVVVQRRHWTPGA